MAQAHLISREPPHRRLLYIRLRPRALSAPGPSLPPPFSSTLTLTTTRYNPDSRVNFIR